jgi:hypothetical protein
MRYWAGHEPLTIAKAKAEATPLRLAPDIVVRRPDRYPAFISVLGHLQATMGDQNIFAPGRKLGEVLGIKHETVARYVRWAIEDGYLEPKAPCKFSTTPGASKAAEFRFAVERFANLSAKR